MNILLSPRGVYFGKRSDVFEGVAYSKLSILNILVFKLVTNFSTPVVVSKQSKNGIQEPCKIVGLLNLGLIC